MVVLDWYTKKITRYYAGMTCRAADWWEALDMAVNTAFLMGVYNQGLHFMSDNGSQPTSLSFIRSAGIWALPKPSQAMPIPKATPIPRGC